MDQRPEPDVAVLVVSCDRYADLWEPFFRCWFKYWPDCPYPVFLGSGESVHGDARVRPLAVGKDVSYCDNLAAMLTQMQETWVITWVEDRLLSGPVETARVASLVSAARLAGAGYMKLIPEDPMAYTSGVAEWGEIPRGAKYRISMTVALWSRRLLLDLLQAGESAWELEKNGSRRSDGRPEPFLALSPALRRAPPISQVHTVVKGKTCRSARDFFRREQLEAAFSLRPEESFGSGAYTAAYHCLFALLRPLQHRWLTFRSRQARGELPTR